MDADGQNFSMDGVTHSFGEPQDEVANSDWQQLFNQLNDMGGGGDFLMHGPSLGDIIGVSGLINLQNHQNQDQLDLHCLNPAFQGLHSRNSSLMDENALENDGPRLPGDNTGMFQEVLGTRNCASQMEDRSLSPGEVDLGESKMGSIAVKDSTRRRVRGRKRKGNEARAILGEESKVLFVVAPLNDHGHNLRMRSSNTHFSAVWSYLKACVNKDNDILVGGGEGDGIIGFGDEMMMVAMEFLCSLFDAKKGNAKKGNINSSGVVKGRVTQKIYSSSIVALLNDCHFMSSR